MFRDKFKKFQNIQMHSECVLVSALNALNYLSAGEKIIKPTDKLYIEYVDFLEVRNKGISVLDNKVRELWVHKLGIYPKWSGFSLFEKRYGKEVGDLRQIPLPIQTTVIIPPSDNFEGGSHVVLIIDHNVECDAYQVCNFTEYTTETGWIFVKDFNNYRPKSSYFIHFDLVDNI
jgi:hypothetical protein